MKRTLLMTAIASMLTAACGVNELPAHRDSIQTVQLDLLVASDFTLAIQDGPAPPAPPEGHAPDPIYEVLSSVEADVFNRLRFRLETEVRHDVLTDTFGTAVADDLALGIPEWRLLTPGPAERAADARFLFEIQRMKLIVGDDGLASVDVQVKMTGVLTRNGETIYKDWTSFRAPLAAQGRVVNVFDPFLERHYNVLELDALSRLGLTQAFYAAADQAASAAVRELIEDTYDR